MTVSSIEAVCPDGPCRFASGGGGGIASFGDLTLEGTRVTDNLAGGPLSSDSDGGGVYSLGGALTLERSVTAGNRALAVPPYGRFAEGGGVFADGGSLAVRDSVIHGNAASLTSSLPASGDTQIDMNANAGAIHVGDGTPTVIAGNRLLADVRDTADNGPQGDAVELDGGGTIAAGRIMDNTQVVRSANGDAAVGGALAILNFDGHPQPTTASDTVISGNRASAFTATGAASAQGAGVFNDSLLTLRRVVVRDNVAHADDGAQGGGVYNGDTISGPPVELALDHTLITGNRAAEGGGLFTTYPFTQTATVIRGNELDDCSGC